MAIKDEQTKTRTPKLRFPEFRILQPWAIKDGGDLFDNRVEDGSDQLPIYSVTMDEGLVRRSSLERKIDDIGDTGGNKKVHKGDIAYNMMRVWQGASGVAPEDCMVSPAYVVLAPREDVRPEFYGYFFKLDSSLRLFTSHARGANKDRLRLYYDSFARTPLPQPSPAEQRKIAACLTSLDELLAAEGRKLAALRAHKKALMQQLFPRPGESRPRLRFAEFRDAGEWEEATVGSKCKSFSGGTPETARKDFYGGTIPFIRSAEIGSEATELFLTDDGLKNSAAKTVDVGDVLVALYGANSGDVALARVNGAINQAILCLRPEGDRAFLYHYLTAKKGFILATYIQGGQGNLSGEIVKSVVLGFPARQEQQRIAACLSSLDALIAAASRKLDGLRAHKKGLMQLLFPSSEGM